MPDIGLCAAAVAVLAIAAHYVSIGLALYRVSKPTGQHLGQHQTARSHQPVSIVRPVCGVDQHDVLTLGSSFQLDAKDYEVIFCCAKQNDPAVLLVTSLISHHQECRAQLLVADDTGTANPKLNNLIKGWAAARHDWIVIADSNVLMPPDYMQRLHAAWRSDTGLVCSPPAGSRPEGVWAEIECAFLNTYQARWQLAADSIGLGFAQGKTMLWRRDLLDCAGGILALGSEIAEDAAATKIVRKSGRRVRLVDRPFEQPVGDRTAKQVWDRQLRWARLRRATFARYFIPEVLTGFMPPLVTSAIAFYSIDTDPAVSYASLLAVWYLPEFVLNARAGWHFSIMTPAAWFARDLLIPVVWGYAWLGSSFQWRGNDMTTATRIEAGTARAQRPPLHTAI